MKITLIIPVFNEIKAIDSIIQRVTNYLDNNTNFDCIIINDGSNDGTENNLTKIKHDKIKVLNKENGGYGSAIKYGSTHVKTDYFAIIDADGTYPFEKFNEMTTNLEDYTMVVGSRTSKNSSIPFIKKIPKYFIKLYSNYITKTNILDFNSGMRIFKTSEFRKFMFFIPDGFSLTTTMTIIFSSLNYKIRYVEIDYFERLGYSKIKPIQDTINFFVTISKLGMYFKPFRLYGPFISFFLIIGFLLLFYRFFFGEGFLVITILSFLISFFLLIFCLISSSISQLIFMRLNDESKEDK